MFERTQRAEDHTHGISGKTAHPAHPTPPASGAVTDETEVRFVAALDASSHAPAPGECRMGRVERQLALLLQWLRSNTFVPDWLPDRWRHERAGYIIAALAQMLGTLTTVLLVGHFPFFPHYAVLDTLDFLTICLIALSWGAGPSLIATFVGAALLGLVGLLQPHWTLHHRGDLIDVGMFVTVGMVVTIVASRTEQARRGNAEKYRRARELAMTLHETNERMDAFLSLVTHELKTPLAAMGLSATAARRALARHAQGWGDTAPTVSAGAETTAQGKVTRGDTGQVIEQHLDTIQRQLRLQTRLIDDLLDVARIQSGHLELQMAPCDLVQTVLQAVEDQRMLFPDRAIELRGLLVQEAGHSGAIPINGDADRIHQVVANYLTNALKYSPRDRPVWVSLNHEGASVRVAVCDAGPGLSAEEQGRIWQRFYRVVGVERQNGHGAGLGLGLYICKTIVERHGGAVGVESQSGQGSTFYFYLPL